MKTVCSKSKIGRKEVACVAGQRCADEIEVGRAEGLENLLLVSPALSACPRGSSRCGHRDFEINVLRKPPDEAPSYGQ